MHVAMTFDEERLDREHAMLNRVCVGLMDEGAQVTRLVPRDVEQEDAEEKAVALAERIAFQPRVVPWLESQRLAQVAARFEKGAPDIVYAVGEDAWPMSLRMAMHFDVPLVIDAWKDGGPSRRFLRKGAGRVTVAAATNGVARACRRRIRTEAVATVPVGVVATAKPTAAFARSKEMIAISIVGPCRSVKPYDPLLTALSAIRRESPQLRIFLELEGPREHDVWRLVKARSLLDSVSPFTDAHKHRRMLTQSDLLILPDRETAVRTTFLEIMAAGVPVLAVDNPLLDMLIPDNTSLVVREPSVRGWDEQVKRILVDPAAAAQIGIAGRTWIAERHRPTEQVRRLFGLFEQILTGGALTFSPS